MLLVYNDVDGFQPHSGRRGQGTLIWDNGAFRGCGMVVDWLRNRWFYAALVTLRAQSLTPTELLEFFCAAYDANAQIFGPHLIYPERVTRHLGALARAGLIEAKPLEGRRREYMVTGLGAELLDGLGAVGAYGRARYEWLVRYAWIQQHVDPDVPLPDPDPRDSLEIAEGRLLRRSTALLFDVVLGPKWTFAIMAALTWGSLRFSQIIAVVNRAAAASPDVVSSHLVDSVLADRLDALQHLGLVVRAPAQQGHRVVYALTDEGRALMVALEPVARFGIRRNEEMTAAIKAM